MYPFCLEVFKETDRLDFKGGVTFFVGENGTGKSTLLEAIARKFGLTVWGGDKTHILHRNPYETRLYDFLSLEVIRNTTGVKKGFLFRAENFFNFASYVDDVTITDPGILKFYGGSSLHQQSHGEAFLSFLKTRCRLEGLYLLDEPEAALSPSSQLDLLEALWELSGNGTGQFIISTHSPIILSYPEAQILSFDQIPVKQISYEETRSYRFYRRFMNNPVSYLKTFSRMKTDTEEGR
jgi:predicted ATPase